jgi:ribosome-associated protein
MSPIGPILRLTATGRTRRTETLPATAKTAAPKKRAAPRKAAAPKRKADKTLLKAILSQLEDAKAEEVVSIDLVGKSSVTDDVVATGRSNRHVNAIADQLVEKLKADGRKDIRIEGIPQCDWVLVDAGDVIVHIFKPEVRSFYNLEKLWSDAAPIERLAS